METRRAISLSVLLTILATGAYAAPSLDFDRFLNAFRAALYLNDANRVADMTRLPFLFENTPRERAGFIAIYPRLFTAEIRHCLGKARVIDEAGDKVMFCKPYAFYFDRQGGKWKLREFNADGEEMP